MTTDVNGTEIRHGDWVFAPDGGEMKVVAIGGPDHNILHLQRVISRRKRSRECRLSRREGEVRNA